MVRQSSYTRYGSVSRFFHWTIAAGLAWMFFLATLHFIDKKSFISELLWPSHRPLGVVLAAMIVLRVLWTLISLSRRPESLGKLASLGHFLMYALMVAIPFLGLLRQYGSGKGFAPFGLPLMEATGNEVDWMVSLGHLLHGELGWALLVLVLGHVTMAFWHRRQANRQAPFAAKYVNVFPRMWG